MNRTIKGLSLGILTVAMAACATNKSVDQKINAKVAEAEAKSNTKIESVAGQVEQVQQHQKEQDVQIASLSQEAKDALKRATDAGVRLWFPKLFSGSRDFSTFDQSWEPQNAASLLEISPVWDSGFVVPHTIPGTREPESLGGGV